MFARRATLHNLGDVTIVLSKKRRNDGPKGRQNPRDQSHRASAGAILSIYARRWGVEVTIKELKSGLHLGQMQVTKELGVWTLGGAVRAGLSPLGPLVWT